MLSPEVSARLQNPEEYLPKNYADLPVGVLLREYRDKLALIDSLSDIDKSLRELISAMKSEFERRAEVEHTEKFSGEGIAVTVKDKFVAKYDPEKWDSIIRGLVDTGYGYCLQRRLSDAKIRELIDGGVRLPDGLSMTTIKEVSHRRT